MTGGGLAAPPATQLSWTAKSLPLMKAFELAVPVSRGRATVRFEFSSTAGDLCFGATFKGAGEEGFNVADVLHERSRMQTHVTAAEGELKVGKPGMLRLVWDNYGAPWRRERQLSYTVTLLYPEAGVIASEEREAVQRSLRSLTSLRHQVSDRRRKIQDFHSRCEDAIGSLEAKIAEMTAELEKMRGSKDTAASLHQRVDREHRLLVLRQRNAVLDFVVHQGWLTPEGRAPTEAPPSAVAPVTAPRGAEVPAAAAAGT